MADRPLIAVTGATGTVGGRVAICLAAAGARQRLVVRDARRAPRVGAEVREASNYENKSEMRTALEGVETLFLIPASEAVNRVEQHKTAVDAAVAAGVRRIVYLSFVAATADTTFTLGRDHWETEQHIRATGLAWIFPRMNLYTDFIPSMVGADGVIRGPAGSGKLAAVVRDDVADAVSSILTSDGHDGRTYDLTGPSAFSLGEAADAMSRLTHKSIRYHEESDEEAFASRTVFGAPEWEVRGWVGSYWAIRDNTLEGVSSDVELLTGRKPVALEDFLKTHPESVSHVS